MNDYALESLIQRLLAWENTIGSKREIAIAKDLTKEAALTIKRMKSENSILREAIKAAHQALGENE